MNAKEYKEIVTIEIEMEKFKEICMANNLSINIDYNLKKVNVPDYPYAENKKWIEQNEICKREYKKLKEIEFEIIHK